MTGIWAHNNYTYLMKIHTLTLLLIALLILPACTTQMNKPVFPHLNYLTEVTGDQALKFAKAETTLSNLRLKPDPRYQKTYDDLYKIISSKDKLPIIHFVGSNLYNFWQDDIHIRGLIRKTSVASFNSSKPLWTTVLDIDGLAKSESKNWVYKGFTCLQPENKLCLMKLSDGGKDAIVYREFNLQSSQFVTGGFYIPESKTSVDWYDENTLLVGDGTNPTTLTSSGYPSVIKILKRGGQIDQSETIYSGQKTSVSVSANVMREDQDKYIMISESPSFFEDNLYQYDWQTKKSYQVPIPATAYITALHKGQFVIYLRENFKEFKAGSLISVSKNELLNSESKYKIIFTPTKTDFFENAYVSENSIYLETLSDVKRRLTSSTYVKSDWVSKPIVFADPQGNQSIVASSKDESQIYFGYTDFLTPTSYYYLNESTQDQIKKVVESPSFFKSNPFKIEQFKVKSPDGTSIPYFVVSAKNIKLNSKNPTLLYGYGGFEIAMTPNYLASVGKAWLEKGGVYVLANIRGGGEYGPDWHKSVLQKNRHKVYEDFYAVAEDLILRKITSPRYLGIKGGSNGGLLTSVAFTQRPELFGAVISEVPLANMLEYHQWLAGASWMAEYGNPEESDQRKYLLSYSPLHNLEKEKKYPEIYYLTSTKDDRVHPAHARQMVARLKELGHPVLYNENTDGGHGRATNSKDWAEFLALEFTYLYQKLMD